MCLLAMYLTGGQADGSGVKGVVSVPSQFTYTANQSLQR